LGMLQLKIITTQIIQHSQVNYVILFRGIINL
jgi:hypothetical protein